MESVGGVAGGWCRWVFGEMEWWVREGMAGGDFLNFFLGISGNGVYRLRLNFFFWLINRVFRDPISKWTPYGKYSKSDMIRTLKSSF